MSLEGHSAQKTSFTGRSIIVKQIGHAMLRVKNAEGKEDLYLITLPTLGIEGILWGECCGGRRGAARLTRKRQVHRTLSSRE